MSGSAFLLFSALVLLAAVATALLLRPAPSPALPLKEGIQRWSVYRFYPGRFLSGEGPALEGLPDGPRFVPEGPLDRSFPRMRLFLDHRARIAVQKRRGFGRTALWVRLDRRPIALVQAPRRPLGPYELYTKEMNLSLSGNAGRMELELRRNQKLVASISPQIAPSPGAVGMEVLWGEDPLPLLAVATGVGLLDELLARSSAMPLRPTPAA